MAIKAADQCSLVDLTDGYSVMLTNDSYTFPGTVAAAKPGSTSTTVIAMCGSEQVPAAVVNGDIVSPPGVTTSVDTDATQPTITITVDGSVTAAGTVDIPVSLDKGNIIIHKVFTFGIAFTGATGETGATGNGISSVTNYYLTTAQASGVTTETAGWSASPTPTTPENKYLWCYQRIAYTDGSESKTTPAIIGTHGETGASGTPGATGNGISSVTNYYLTTAQASGVTVNTPGWSTNPTPTTTENKYLWCYQKIAYTDSTTADTTPAIIGTHGEKGDTGAAGADAITISITSSNGTIFKNTAISTTLTAHVYKAGQELTGGDLTALGTIKWYKDGDDTPVGSGPTLNISPGDITNKATYIAQLEG